MKNDLKNGRLVSRIVVAIHILISQGYRQSLADHYGQMKGYVLPRNSNLKSVSKKYYDYGQTEKVIEECWNKNQMKNLEGVHLSKEGLVALQKSGWSIAVHTKSHPNLINLTLEQHDDEIGDCYQKLKGAGLNPIKLLSYPHGGIAHVGAATKQWINNSPDWNAVFALGGINRLPNRTEWMRIPIGDEDPASFQSKLTKENVVMDMMQQ